jgi:hypothetical protein
MTSVAATGTKACPDCAESVDAVDAVCRYCGHGFGAQPAPLAMAPAAPAVSTATVAVGGSLSGFPAAAAVAVLGGVLMAIGSVGPWATAAFASVSGTDGDGQLTLVAAVAAISFAVLMGTRKGGTLSAVMTMLAALAGGFVGVIDLQSISHKLQGFDGVAAVGWGLYAVIAGAGLVAIGVLMSAGKKR